MSPPCKWPYVTGSQSYCSSLFNPCSVVLGSWLTAGGLRMLDLANSRAGHAQTWASWNCSCLVPQLFSSPRVLVRHPGPIRSQGIVTGILAISESRLPSTLFLLGSAAGLAPRKPHISIHINLFVCFPATQNPSQGGCC